MRHLPDGCVSCGLSVVYCAAVRDIERSECCCECDHEDGAPNE